VGYGTGGSKELDTQNELTQHSPAPIDGRRQPRFKLQTEIRLHSPSSGLLKGYTVDISESGISAILKLEEVPVGELVQLEFELLFGPVTIRAQVMHQTAFRYGFQFVEPDESGVIKATCGYLATPRPHEQDAAPQL
jgi:PilZ domain-containing protein